MTPYLATKNSLVCMVTGEKTTLYTKKVAKLQGRWQNFKEGGKTSRKVAKLQGRWQNFKEGGKTSRKVAKQRAELMIFILNLFSRSAKF